MESQTVLRIFGDIVNTPSVTSIAALNLRAATEYHPTLLEYLDSDNSEIIRTVNPSGVKTHYARIGSTRYLLNFTLEFPVYDDPSRKWYVQYDAGPNSGSHDPVLKIGDGISGGTIDSGTMPMTVERNGTGDVGTELILSNSFSAATQIMTAVTNIRTFWAYITDNGWIWCATRATSVPGGFQATYNNSANFVGPFFYSQYTRLDRHNNIGNNVIPVAYSNPRSVSIGFGQLNDYTEDLNPLYTTSVSSNPMRVINLVDARPKATSTTWPILYHPYVDHAVSGRGAAMNDSASATANQDGWAKNIQLTTDGGQAGGKFYARSASERFPTADLLSSGFALLPFGWTHSYYNNIGGNISDRNGYYVFNGDYQPGDIFSFRNKIWMVWPFYNGFADRIGFAIPKE